MTEPWCRRPKAPRGDSSPDSIFCGVGRALTMWEIIEYHVSIAYIGLIHLEQYPHDNYFALSSFAQRHKLVQKAIETNVNGKDCCSFGEFMDMVLRYSLFRVGSRRRKLLNSLRDSYAIEDKKKQREKGQRATGANRCKWDSTAAAGGSA
jgi:hypothetical protein